MDLHRYHRQTLLPQIGPEGQRKLLASTVGIVGLGALGSVAAELLARAGVGRLRLIDRDLVELSNLQRQLLYRESDVGAPKAHAAHERLRAVNSTLTYEPLATDLHPGNAGELLAGCDLLVDATDNAATRYLVNDFAVREGVPWVYGGGIATTGRVAAFNPRESLSPCLRCLFRSPPDPGELQTCDTAGVLGPVTSVVASLESLLALRLLIEPGFVLLKLLSLELWDFRLTSIGVERDPHCPCCVSRRFEFLEGQTPPVVSLCGRNTTQVLPTRRCQLDLREFEARWRPHGAVTLTPFLLRLRPEGGLVAQVTLFADGRLLVEGREAPPSIAHARAFYDRLVGT